MDNNQKFPVLNAPADCTKWVNWSALNNKWAIKVHSQSLERLAERGGLSPVEIYWNLNELPWNTKVSNQQAIDATNNIAF